MIIIAAIACYAFVAYLEHEKKLDLIDRGVWKPEEKQEKPEHKSITGLFFYWGALLFGSHFTAPGMVNGLRISGLLTTAAGGKIVRKFRKWRGAYKVKTFGTIHPSSMNNRFTNKKILTLA